MKYNVAVIFAFSSLCGLMNAQIKNDTISGKNKNLETITIKGQVNKKTETALLSDQKKAIVQKQSMGSEEIARKAISNVEQGLTKIAGINQVSDKGIFVRGLEERYNSLLVNQLATPSNNPFQKIIALKQFPTDIVGRLDVYKTFNSDLYGDFAGATFNIETIIPEKSFTKIEMSLGVNTQNSFRKNFRISPNANTFNGYLGENYKDRLLPNQVKGIAPNNYIFNSNESQTAFKDTWNVDKITSMPNMGFGLTNSQVYKMKDGMKMMSLISLNHSSSYSYRQGQNNIFSENGNYKNRLDKTSYSYVIETSALAGISFKSRKLTIDASAFYLQNADNNIEDQLGYRNDDRSNKEFFRTNQLDISRFTDVQLLSSYKINDRNSIKVGGSWVQNQFQQPDRKIFFGNPRANSNELLMSYGGNNLIRQYLDVNGTNYFSALAEYTLKLGEMNEDKSYPLTFNIGYNGFKDFRSTSYRFIFSSLRNSRQDIVTIDQPDATFNQSLNDGVFVYKEGSTEDYKTYLYQLVNAAYANANYKPNPTWDIIAGIRAEKSETLIKYRTVGQLSSFTRINNDILYILPSLAVKKQINGQSNLRFAASKTITRPILIETLPIQYQNPDNTTIQGNGKIKNSENYNMDLKYEIFPKKAEFFAISLFGKILQNPIERSFVSGANSTGNFITYNNAHQAQIYGAEIEGGFGLERFSQKLSRFAFATNFTLMHTNVNSVNLYETDKSQNRKRALQGAAPWTINADIKYALKNATNLNTSVSLVYNVSGSKIYSVGFAGLDNIYERPFHQFDAVFSKELSKKVNFKFSVMNILNSQYKVDLGERSTMPIVENALRLRDYYRGTSFNTSISYTF